ncbi:MAG: FtsQ-type POTRA domain-containing protein [SAR324 cluster bacterium]|nr:FtsQ-type POTRA domain-containing protein [SAR324 cluster bacterium]
MQDLKNRFHNKSQTKSQSYQKKVDIQYGKGGLRVKSSKKQHHLLKRLLMRDPSSIKQFDDAYDSFPPKASALRVFFGFVSFLFTLFVLLGIVLKSYDYFQHPPSQVHIEGASLLSAVEIYEITGMTPGMKLKEIDTFLISNLLNRHPAVKQAEVRQVFPDQLYISLKERFPYAYLKAGDQYYLVDRERYPIQYVSADQAANQFVITGVDASLVQLGKPIPEDSLETGMELIDLIRQSSFDLKTIMAVDVSDLLNIKLKLRDTNSIVQLGHNDYQGKMNRLATIYPQLLQQHKKLRSIDLRYQNRAIVQF